MYQIELFGCTSAGKTTLSKQVYIACKQEGIDLLLHEDYLLGRLKLNWIQIKILRILIIDTYCMIACLLTSRRNYKLYQFCYGVISKLHVAWTIKVNLFRNVLKGIGTYEIIKNRSHATQVVLVDGGTLSAIQPLFVHNNHPLDRDAILTFSKLVPLPDMAIHVEQPEGLLKKRIKQRGHRRISIQSDDRVAEFIQLAIYSYKLLMQNIVNEGWMSNINAQPNILTSNHPSIGEDLYNRILEIITTKLAEASKQDIPEL